MKRCVRLVNLLLVILLGMQPAFAQTQKTTEASLRVTVVDPNGEAVPNARVVVGKQGKEAFTSTRGEAGFSQLAVGKVQIVVKAEGFAPLTIKDFNLKPGANQIEVRLQIAAVEESVVVEQDKREAKTDPRGDAFTTVLTAEQIAALPDDPEEFEQAIRNMAGPGATFRVNGFRGGKLPPKNQIREIRFRTNAYAAESHESSFMSVDILTKPGIDSWHGSFNFGFRD
ncbi:MAG: carboxypeptidase regulatory-like domain-containing protein, partial [Acidobacteria bacterium]|nr:carboxypeptidase regulatory-like domain-containing protein [Acidobacteriota bacterium]